MELAVMQDVGRAQCEFPALNERIGPGDGPEDVRFADVVVVEPIVGAGFKVVGIEGGTFADAASETDSIIPFEITTVWSQQRKSRPIGPLVSTFSRREIKT